MNPWIFHIDLNAFFAEVEVLRNPALKGKAIAVSGHSRRSVVSTASYEARKFGVHSAMPVSEALRLCPELIIVEGHFADYEDFSQRFIAFLRTFSDKVEQASIDEAYVDMTECINNEDYPLDLAVRLQKRLLDEISLKCSIGVAPNKFLAKMASGLRKPMGIVVLRAEEVPVKLWPLPIDDMYGIGKKTAPRLHELGIHTIGDLANHQDDAALRKVLGNMLSHYVGLAHGIDDRPIEQPTDIKSISTSTTMNQDIRSYEEVREIFLRLAQDVENRLSEAGKTARNVGITVRYPDFTTFSRSRRTDHPISTKNEVFQIAMLLFDEAETEESIRLLGISAFQLKNKDEDVKQIDMFTEGDKA
jgi:DNA polymerase-4